MSVRSALFLSSGDLLADRRYGWARDLEARGDLAGAADILAQALELAPEFASAWFALGEIRRKIGNRDDAVEAFANALKADPHDRHGAALHLALLGAGEAGAMPPAYVRALFDDYAGIFDGALEALSYRAPSLLLSAVQRAASPPFCFGAMLDLGCGTGLAGAVFRPHVSRLVGIDLSPGMIAKAREKGLHDRLVVADLLDFLSAETDGMVQYHLVIAADVFVYVADLATVAAAIARLLAPGGILAFTTETHGGSGVVLGETLRYAHNSDHVRAILASADLRLIALEETWTRLEKGVQVPGLLVTASR